MKAPALFLLIGLLALSGCASHYVMRLNNGTQIITASKPKLKNNVYTFKDAKGEKHFIGASRVHEIEPASLAAQEDKPKVQKVKRKHKWTLWLA